MLNAKYLNEPASHKVYFSSATDPFYLSTQTGVFGYAFLSLITLNNLVRKLKPYRLPD